MTTPEQTLWREVLALAVQDAIVGSTDAGQTKQTKINQTIQARTYLTTASADLATVCTLADLDPVAVREAMIKRIAAAPTPEQLFSVSRRRMHSATIMLTHEGQTHDLTTWAKITGVSKQALRNRVRKKWDAQRILTTPTHMPKAEPKPKAKRSAAKQLTHDGQTRTIAQWSKATGIPQTILHMRERSGWNAERILTTPYTPRRQRGVVPDFAHDQGTGGGTAAQETPNITFQDALT